MRKTRTRTLASRQDTGVARVLLLAGLAMAMVTVACSPIRRHAVLDFVFDGVPPYLTPEERVRLAVEAAARAEQEDEEDGRAEETARRLNHFVHGPYAAKECERCHDMGAASGFRSLRATGAAGPASKMDLAEGGRLLMPPTQLCLHCHTDFAEADPADPEVWIHGPVATGWCIACHQPHTSAFASLVVAEPSARLCGQCHLREDLLAYTPEHRPGGPQEAYPPPPQAAEQLPDDADPDTPAPPEVLRVAKDCTRCHDPHRATNRVLLREPRTWALVRKPEPAPEPPSAQPPTATETP